jgi:CheY-like chemotaxis protein
VPDRPHILVVDDDAALLENMAECLSGEGFDVSVARDASEALARLDLDPRPAVVVIDQLMPGMTGIELMARIRSRPALAGVRLVLVSGLPPDRATGQGDADAIMEKPFGVDELIGTLRAQLVAA